MQLAIGLMVTVALVVAAAWAPVQAALEAQRREAAAARAWEGMRPSLGTPEGEALLDEFLEAAPYRGTTAVAQAWLRRGDDLSLLPRPRLDALDASTEHVEAWARALTEAPDPTIRAEALLRLARNALEERQFADLRVLLDALAALPVAVVPTEQILTLELEYAVGSGDRSHAVAAWDQARAQGLPIAARVTDPRWELPGLRAAERLDLPTGLTWIGVLRGGSSPQAIVKVGTRAHLFALTPTVRELASAEVGALRPSQMDWRGAAPVQDPLAGAIMGDVDGDGVQEAYRGQARVVSRLGADGQTWEPILPEVLRTNTELVIDVADLDADGRDELIVGLGEWRGYDLRVYSWESGAFRLRARTQRNAVNALTTIADPWGSGRLILIGEHQNYPNANKHGADHPQGPPAGLVVRRLVGDHLEDLFMQSFSGWFERFLSVDVDGDGHEEILFVIAGVDDAQLLATLRPTATPGFAVSTFAGLGLKASGQFDDDPAIELVVSRQWDGEVMADGPEFWTETEYWILGRGDQPVPSVPRPSPTPLALPEGALEGALAQVWRDAALLVDASLIQSAARLLQRAATLARDPEAAAGASGLWERLGRFGLAAEAMEVAAQASDGGATTARWEAAVRLHLMAADPDAAMRVVERWRAADGRGPAGELETELAAWQDAREHRVILDPRVALDAPWQVGEPLAIEQTNGQTWLNLLGSGAPVLQAPLRPLGGPVALVFDGWMDRQEWRATARISLRLGTDERIGAEYVQAGTARAYHPVLRCMVQQSIPAGVSVVRPATGAAAAPPLSLRFRLTWTPEDQTWRCSVRLPDHEQEASVVFPASAPETLTVGVDDHTTVGDWVSVRIDRLEVWGVAPAGEALDARQQASLALVRQDPAAALALLPADALVDRAIAQAALRHPVEAMDSFSAAMTRDAEGLERRLPYLLRLHRDSLAPLLRSVSGADWPARVATVYELPIFENQPIPDVEEALRAELEDVALPDDPEDPAWWLMAQRVGALLRGPDPARGRAAAAEWLAAFEALDLPREHDLGYRAYTVHYELALAAAAAGDLDTAKREAQAAVDVSPTPVVAPDRFKVSPIWQKAGLPLPVAHPWD